MIKSYNPTFMAHLYDVMPCNPSITIETDNEDNLGKNPYIVYEEKGERKECEMKQGEGVYSYKLARPVLPETFRYHIEYKDTGKTDKKSGSEDYCIHPESMNRRANGFVRGLSRQPMIHAINEGHTVGKIKYIDYIEYNDDI